MELLSRKYRDNGAVGALMDEYEKALLELIEVIKPLNDSQLTKIIDKKTEDEDCRSVQTVLAHVISASYNYVIEIRNSLGEKLTYTKPEFLNTVSEYNIALKDMFYYNEKLFEDYPNLKLEEKDINKKIYTGWNQYYDVEQLYEHAIVHILRHRRQIQRFINKLKTL